jgi:isoquinoline 1-oxidoreductase
MGKEFLRRDATQKVTGEAQYAGDIRLPGMLYAKLVRSFVHGAKLKSVDTSAAEKVEGAKVVRDGDLIAVLHKNPDEAALAASQIKAEFDSPTLDVDSETIFDHLLKNAGEGRLVGSPGGQHDEGERLAQTIVEQAYLDGYKAHAAIETHTALANVEGDKVTVWASTQTPFPLREQVARELGIPPADVRVISPLRGRWIRRQDRQPASHRGREVVQSRRQARSGGLEPGRGVLL